MLPISSTGTRGHAFKIQAVKTYNQLSLQLLNTMVPYGIPMPRQDIIDDHGHGGRIHRCRLCMDVGEDEGRI